MNNKMSTVKGITESSDSEAEDSDEGEMVIVKSEADDSEETEMLNLKRGTEDFDETVVALDTYNSDLNLVINESRFSAQPLSLKGFYFMWAGARATHGASEGKFCFEVKILKYLDGKNESLGELNPNNVRVGFSVESSSMQLGEDSLSYGYDGTGKIATDSQFQDFGESFQSGDVILGAVNVDSEQVQIGFVKNGKFLGWAFKGKSEGHAFFPHVLTKNVEFEVNLGQKDQPYFPLPDALKDFTFIGCLPPSQRVGGTRGPKRKEDCEVIMMCGLPGAGKTTWATEHAANNPGKKFNMLGVSYIMDKMKVMGLPHARRDHGKWHFLVHKAKMCMISMYKIGSTLRRNYILDQNNTNPNEAREMMLHFDGFHRKAAVVLPSEEEYALRREKRNAETKQSHQAGKPVPGKKPVGKYFRIMKAHFHLPEVNDIFTEVIYTELQKEDAENLVIQYNDSDNKKYFQGIRRPKIKWIRGIFKKILNVGDKFSELNTVFEEMGLQQEYSNRRHSRVANRLHRVLEKCLKANYKLSELRDMFNEVIQNDGPSASNGSGRQFDSFSQRGSFSSGRGFRGGFKEHRGGKNKFGRKRKFDDARSQGNNNFASGYDPGNNFHGDSRAMFDDGRFQGTRNFQSGPGNNFGGGSCGMFDDGRFQEPRNLASGYDPGNNFGASSSGNFHDVRSQGPRSFASGYNPGNNFGASSCGMFDGRFQGTSNFASSPGNNFGGGPHGNFHDARFQEPRNFASDYDPCNNFGGGSRGNFHDARFQGSRDFSIGLGNNFSRGSHEGNSSIRQGSSQSDGSHSLENSREWYTGDIFGQDPSFASDSGSQVENLGGESQRSCKKEPAYQ